MRKNFENNGISKKLYTIYETALEDFNSEKFYDIIIAEGFISCCSNKKELIGRLKSLCGSRGIVVITCSDEIGFFIESMKRLVYSFVVRDVTSYDDKVNKLTEIISEQMKGLRGASRSPKEYVMEMMLDNMSANGNFLSIEEAIDYFGNEFYLLGTSSPKMFTDYSWFKDIWYDSKLDVKEQFKSKRLSLLMANMPEVVVSTDLSDILVDKISKVVHMSYKYGKNHDEDILVNINDELNLMSKYIDVMPDNFLQVFEEIKLAIGDMITDCVDISKYKRFNAAFGRSQQYVAFEKVK